MEQMRADSMQASSNGPLACCFVWLSTNLEIATDAFWQTAATACSGWASLNVPSIFNEWLSIASDATTDLPAPTNNEAEARNAVRRLTANVSDASIWKLKSDLSGANSTSLDSL